MKTIKNVKTFISNNKYRFYYGLARIIMHMAWWDIKVIKVSPYENKRIKSKNFVKEFYSDKGRLLVSNHKSMWDIIFGMYPFSKNKKKINVIAKKELFKFKPFGKLLETCGGFPVDRNGGDLEAAKKSIKTLKNDETLLMYPEGTRHKKGLVTNDCSKAIRLSKTKGKKEKRPVDVVAINIQYKWPRALVLIRDGKFEVEDIKNTINELPGLYEKNRVFTKIR